MASMTYGGLSSVPSTRTPCASSSKEVCATTRTRWLISIASTPALRSSSMPSRRWVRLKPPLGSSTVTSMPGPVAGDGAGQHRERGQLALGLLERGRATLGAAAELVAGLLEVGDVALGLPARRLQPVEGLDELVLPEPGVGVAAVADAHLGHRGEGQDRHQHGHHRLAPRGAQERVPEALAPAGPLGGLGAHPLLVRSPSAVLMRGRGGGGWRRRWRRSGSRGPRPRPWRAGHRPRACRRGRRSARRSARC